MPSCLICHMDIGDGGKDVEKSYSCPNGHPVHESCLVEWSLHSPKCPLCDKDYDSYIMAKIKAHLEQKAKEEELSLEDKLLEQRRARIKQVAEKMVFFKKPNGNLTHKTIKISFEINKGLQKLRDFAKSLENPEDIQNITFSEQKEYTQKQEDNKIRKTIPYFLVTLTTLISIVLVWRR